MRAVQKAANVWQSEAGSDRACIARACARAMQVASGVSVQWSLH